MERQIADGQHKKKNNQYKETQKEKRMEIKGHFIQMNMEKDREMDQVNAYLPTVLI